MGITSPQWLVRYNLREWDGYRWSMNWKHFLFRLPGSKWSLLRVFAVFAVVLFAFVHGVEAQVGTGIFRVDFLTGNDSSDCGSAAIPCKNIQQAVNLADSGDTILVATGTYSYDAALDISCTPSTGKTAVVCILNAEIQIFGGYDGADWVHSNPVVNQTVIDGENLWRGVRVADTNPSQESVSGLRMEGFWIRRGLAGHEVGGDNVSRAFGGGFESLFSKVELRDLVFEDNFAIGIDSAIGSGGWGLGGGLSVRVPLAGSILERIRFENNEARGGSGPDVGGFGIGGGMLLSDPNAQGALLTAVDLEFVGNIAAGGDSTGSPSLQDVKADAQGGAVAFQGGSWVAVLGLSATGNTAIGGASNGYGGGAFGGAVFLERGLDVQLSGLDLRENFAIGGDGADGGLGEGGGVMSAKSQFSLEKSVVIFNTARGGAGSSGFKGAPGGGGLAIQRMTGTTTVSIVNTVIADNLAEESSIGTTKGGGGGGIFVVGAEVAMAHVTLADNRLNANSNQGLGIVLVNGGPGTTMSLDHGIVADHTEVQGESSIHVQSASTITMNNVMFAGNEDDTNSGDANSGIFIGLDTTFDVADAGFRSPGSPEFDYHLIPGSSAIDGASESTETEDFENQARDDAPDIGADELGEPSLFSDGFESGSTEAWDSTFQ